jgi:putative MATE family efflux protein
MTRIAEGPAPPPEANLEVLPESGQAAAAAAPRPLRGRLAGLSLNRQVAVLAVWPLMQQLLNWLVGTVDTAAAARVSIAAADAIAIAGYVGWFLMLMHMAVGTGSAAIIARAIGGGHQREANAALGQGLLLAIGWGTAVGAGLWLAAPLIGRLANLDGEALRLCVEYLRIITLVSPIAAILMIGNASLGAAGDTRTPFGVMVVINAVNVSLTLWLVSRGWGVMGIAIGTAVAYALGGIIVTAVLLRRGAAVRLRWLRMRPRKKLAWRIVRLGIPNLTERLGQWLGNWAVVMLVGLITAGLGVAGDGLFGSHIIAIRIEALSFLPGAAFGVAAAALTGQYLGAHDPVMARRAARRCWVIGGMLMGWLGLMFVLIPELLVRAMSPEAVHLQTAPDLVRICGAVQFFFASSLILGEAMRGAGDTRGPAVIVNLSTWGVRLPAAWLLGVHLGWGLTGVWLGLCGELALRGMLFIWRYRGGAWLRAEV